MTMHFPSEPTVTVLIMASVAGIGAICGAAGSWWRIGGLARRLDLLERRVQRHRHRLRIEQNASAMTGRAAVATTMTTSIACVKGVSSKGETIQPSAELLPRILFSRHLLKALAGNINLERMSHPSQETGMALVGRIEGDGPGRRIVVNALIDAGNRTDRSAGHVRFDRAYQQAELEALQVIDSRASHMGDAHLHPGSMDHCSAGDYVTDAANVRASQSREMVFVIATVAAAHAESRPNTQSVYVDGLKLDAYYLGHASNFQYRKVVPEAVDEPLLVVPPAFRLHLARRPVQTRLDWACLRILPGWSLRMIELPQLEPLEQHGVNGLNCVELTQAAGGRRVLIRLAEDADAAPQVIVDDGTQLSHFLPKFLNSHFTPHLWLTAIILAVEAEWHSSSSNSATTDATDAASLHTTSCQRTHSLDVI